MLRRTPRLNLLHAHGSPTNYGYNHGCRCPACRGAQNERVRNFQRRYREEHGIGYALALNPEKRRSYRRAQRRQWVADHPEEWAARSEALAQRHHRGAKRRRAITKLKRAARGTTGSAVWYSGRCAECGCWVTAKGHKPRYCSDSCKARASAGRHRVRRRGWKVTRIRRFAIYERDNWTCQICGDPVNRHAEPSAADAPSLDHIVPVARGGPHCESNLQCAHLYCNSVKRDTDLCLLTA